MDRGYTTLPAFNTGRPGAMVSCERCPTALSRNNRDQTGLCSKCRADFAREKQRAGGNLTIPEFLSRFPWQEDESSEHDQVRTSVPQSPFSERVHDLLLPGMIYAHPAMMRVATLVRKVAHSEMPVLITGETGTGKELVAKAIHGLSLRSTRPYRVVDCTTLTPDIAPNELFGHIAGAFTSASRNQPGILAEANGGTVFLDELSVLPLAIQAQFLRVLENQEYRPVGAAHYQPLNIRVVAASNESLQELMRGGRFRKDLYHRINTFPVSLPPLRERGEDIALLTQYFLKHQGVTAGIVPEAMARLNSYHWPGNVRELHHVLARACILREEANAPITCNELPSEIFEDRHME